MRIVITGGPASGKSTIIDAIREKYPNAQFIPEVATSIFLYYKLTPPNDNESLEFWQWLWSVQKLISMHQVTLEEHIFDTITPKRLNEFVILDRGLYDNVAYIRRIPNAIQEQLYHAFGDKYRPIANIYHAISRIQKLAEGKHHFYDCVIILKTTGHEKDLYNKLKASNPARYESAEEAVEIEQKIIESYTTAREIGLVGNVKYVDTLDLKQKTQITLDTIEECRHKK